MERKQDFEHISLLNGLYSKDATTCEVTLDSIIKVSDLTYDVPDHGEILHDINLEVRPGEIVGLLGHNGAGKTTLLDNIMGFRSPTAGVVNVMGQEVVHYDRSNFERVSYISQDVQIKENLTIEKFLKFHAGLYPGHSLERQSELMELFNLDLGKKIGSLSTGAKKRVQIVSAFAIEPTLIVVDEITATLDPQGRVFFFELLKEVVETNRASVLIATNITSDLKENIDRLYFLKDTLISEKPVSEMDSLFRRGA